MTDNAVRRNFSTPRSSATCRRRRADDAAVERVLKRLAGPLPRQKLPLVAAARRAARLAVRAGLAARRRARLLRRARLRHRHRRRRPPLRRQRRALRRRQQQRHRLDRVRARSLDRSAPMTVAQYAATDDARLVALAAARLARAQSVLRRRRGGDGGPRAGPAGLGPQRVRARRAHRRHAAAGRCRPAARPDQRQPRRSIDDAQTKYHSAQDDIHDALRREPFDVDAMRAAMAQTRRGAAGLRSGHPGRLRVLGGANVAGRPQSLGRLAARPQNNEPSADKTG